MKPIINDELSLRFAFKAFPGQHLIDDIRILVVRGELPPMVKFRRAGPAGVAAFRPNFPIVHHSGTKAVPHRQLIGNRSPLGGV